MMKLNFYLMASFPAKSNNCNKENLICQIILPDRNTAHSSLFEYMVLILVGFKHKYFHFIDRKIFSTNKEWRICIGWTLISIAQIAVAIWICICSAGNVQVMVSSKCWPIFTVAADPTLVVIAFEWHLSWPSTRWVHKAE